MEVTSVGQYCSQVDKRKWQWIHIYFFVEKNWDEDVYANVKSDLLCRRAGPV